MEAFADGRPIERGPVNIHQVLNHVRRIVRRTASASGVRFVENYDPSLPDGAWRPRPADPGVPQPGEERLPRRRATASARSSLSDSLPPRPAAGRSRASRPRSTCPWWCRCATTAAGVPDEIRAHLFDAFVTNKPTGTGLGLALVAKIINDHGGAIEFDSEPGRTTFRVMLPLQSRQTRTHEQRLHHPGRRRRSRDPHRPAPGAGPAGPQCAQHRRCRDAVAVGPGGRGPARHHRRGDARRERPRPGAAHPQAAARPAASSS